MTSRTNLNLGNDKVKAVATELEHFKFWTWTWLQYVVKRTELLQGTEKEKRKHKLKIKLTVHCITQTHIYTVYRQRKR